MSQVERRICQLLATTIVCLNPHHCFVWDDNDLVCTLHLWKFVICIFLLSRNNTKYYLLAHYRPNIYSLYVSSMHFPDKQDVVKYIFVTRFHLTIHLIKILWFICNTRLLINYNNDKNISYISNKTFLHHISCFQLSG